MEVTWGFPALLTLALLIGAGEVLPQVLTAALCHELGHLAALRVFGAPVRRVRLTALGAEIEADTRRLSYGREIFCTLAGPVVNLVLALALSRALGAYVAAGANLLLGCFNLLPVPSLDGGRALWLLVSFLADPMLADRVCRWVGLLTAAALTAGALALVLRQGTGLFLLPAALGTLFPQLPLVKPRETM